MAERLGQWTLIHETVGLSHHDVPPWTYVSSRLCCVSVWIYFSLSVVCQPRPTSFPDIAVCYTGAPSPDFAVCQPGATSPGFAVCQPGSASPPSFTVCQLWSTGIPGFVVCQFGSTFPIGFIMCQAESRLFFVSKPGAISSTSFVVYFYYPGYCGVPPGVPLGFVVVRAS